MLCKFKTISENTHECEACGYQIKIAQVPEKIFRNCDQSPSLLGMAKSAAEGAVNYILTGAASEQEKSSRLEICNKCDHFQVGRCDLCGCYMSIKATIAGEKCPIDKW